MKKYIDLEEFKQKHTCFGYVNEIKEEELDEMAVEGILIPSSSAAALSDVLDSAREVSNRINKVVEELAVALSNETNKEGQLPYPYIRLTFEDSNGCYNECFEDINGVLDAIIIMWKRNVLDKTDECSKLYYVVGNKDEYQISLEVRPFSQSINPNAKLIKIENREESTLENYYLPYDTLALHNSRLLVGILNQIREPTRCDTILRADDGSEVFLVVRKVE